MAVVLAQRGARVGVVARREDRLRETLERCQEQSPDSAMWVTDLSDPEAGVRLVNAVWENFDGLDCLVNNVGVGKRKNLLDHTPEDLDVVFRTNFFTPVRMALALIPKMLGRGSGAIVNVASGGGRFGIVHESAYCASKFALSGWSEVAAIELAETPIEMKLVQPGAIATEIWERKPGELPGLPGAQFATSEECAIGIADALETDGFEFFVPPDLADHVALKNADPKAWINLMVELGKTKESA